MISVDTTLLVELRRERDLRDSGARRLLEAHPGETFVVPAHAAGEFLEGGAAVSAERLAQSLVFLELFRIGRVDLETARQYATLVSELRKRSVLSGRSKPDLWIAAWAVQHGAPLATRNLRHFEGIPRLELLPY